MTRRASLLLFATCLIAVSASAAKQAPNIVLILAEDLDRDWISCYGSDHATPNIDRLAQQGVRYETAWNMIESGSSQTTALTGQYPFRQSASGRAKTSSSKEQTTVAHILRSKGYATASTDEHPELGFDEQIVFQDTESDNRNLDLDKFLKRKRDNPFFIYYSIHNNHALKPSKSDMEPYADYVDEMDRLVGKWISTIDQAGLADNTLIVFASSSQAKGQGRLADIDAHAAFIVRAPSTPPGGRVSKDLVDFSDLYPTFLDIASIRAPKSAKIDGQSLVPSLRGSDDPFDKRNWIYSQSGDFRMIRDWHHLVDNRGAFHDLEKDPLQQEEVSPLDKQAPHRRERLQVVLDRLSGKTVPSLQDRILGHQ